jgi:acyl-CoA reductase-like NAD-dependent aldehyde dehydrogenase
VKLLIGGRDCDASDKTTFKRLSPVTGEQASRAAAATLADADAACEAAAEAFPAGAGSGPNERRKLLLKAADLLDERAPEFIGCGAAEAAAPPCGTASTPCCARRPP